MNRAHILVLLFALAGLRAAGGQSQIYVTVVDGAQAPVSGLGTADFVLRDGATRVGVLNAVPAADPLSIAVVVHGFDAIDRPVVRRAIDDLVRTMDARNPGSRVGLMIGDDTLGWRVTMLAAGGSGADAALAQLAGGGRRDAVEGLVAACQALHEAPADRRAILAIVRRQAGDGVANARGRLTSAILEAHAALWTVEVAPAAPAAPGAVLDDALTEGVRLSGALRETVSAIADVPAATARTAGRWLSQYLVTYTWPEPMVSQFSLTTRHDAGEVLTPAWTR